MFNATPSNVRPIRQFAATDVGNAERLVFHYGRDFHYVEEWDEFVVWNGTLWERDPQKIRMGALAKKISGHIKAEARGLDDDAAKKLYAWACQSQTSARISAMIYVSRSEKGVQISHKRLDTQTWKLPCLNCTVDLKTGGIQLSEQSDFHTRALKTRYDRKAKAPLWTAFIQQVIPDPEVRRYVQKYIGYSLTGQVGERCFVVFYGGGKNGKSVFLRVVQALLGSYGTACAPGLLMAQKYEAHPAEVADLFGARLAVASEVKKGRSFDEEKVKKLTGNDILKARRMNENWWEFEPTHKLLLATNHKPRVTDATDSFWDRIALVDFTVRIDATKVDPTLAEKIIEKELSGVLTWAVDGCLLWQKEGLKLPKSIQEATTVYRRSEDIIGCFFEECTKFEAVAWTPLSMLTAAAEKWCMENAHYPLKSRDINEWLLQHGCFQKRNSAGNTRGWKGIRLVAC